MHERRMIVSLSNCANQGLSGPKKVLNLESSQIESK